MKGASANWIWQLVGGIASLLFIAILIYFQFYLERTQFFLLVGLFSILAGLYLFLLYTPINTIANHFKWMIALGIISRLVIVFGLPNLSDDYFRFLWDGYLSNQGISPFAYLPSHLVAEGIIDTEYTRQLFESMNSPDYYTVYPPINQYFFSFANFLFPKSIWAGVITLKVLMFFFELLSIATLIQLTKRFKRSKNTALLYVLNPLIIIEFCGNLHFEGIMISFLLLTIYLLDLNKWKLSAFSFAGAILTKLHPLMLLPFIIKFLGWKRGFLFSILSGLIVIALFSPIMTPFNQAPTYFSNILTSLRLYFENFEFNGGIYYIMRWIGTNIYGYNPIHIVGKVLMIANIIGLVLLFLLQKKGLYALVISFIIAYLLYTLLATTVHPWYILMLLPFSILIRFKTPLVWSIVIILSYFAYSTNDWHENFYLIAIEYIFVSIFLFFEIRKAFLLNENHN